jgi:hypothetical protein
VDGVGGCRRAEAILAACTDVLQRIVPCGGGGLRLRPGGMRGGGAGLEVDRLLQQSRDALHFELDGGGGDAPLVFAAHVCDLTMQRLWMAMLLGTHY